MLFITKDTVELVVQSATFFSKEVFHYVCIFSKIPRLRTENIVEYKGDCVKRWARVSVCE